MSTTNGNRRPSLVSGRQTTAPSVIMNGHFASADGSASKEQYSHGVQVISSDKEFNPNLGTYFSMENVTPAGFNYHLVSVFGSQSTGKSTLLNHLFGTEFGVMDESIRQQTTKGIWLSKNKKQKAESGGKSMADNIMVMDVEGTDGRERGDDQDFERKSALFALATSEVLIVNMWEHQVGLYQGANMSLLKTVFEVNLQLFLKDRKSVPRSLLFFVIRDHSGQTPLVALQKTLMQDLSKIWSSISKPSGLEKSTIEDYFDFTFAALPHKVYQPEKFVSEVGKLGDRFREGFKDPKRNALQLDDAQGIFLPEFHRRIPADGFPMYASGIWDQIVNNKDLDLPTQQELLAQYRCDEIAREALVSFDERVVPLEEQQAAYSKRGSTTLLTGLGIAMKESRHDVLKNFQTEASRYHKAVFTKKLEDLRSKVDTRLKALLQGQLSTAHKLGVTAFGEAVSEDVRQGQKRNNNYDFAEIVETQKAKALELYEREAKLMVIEGASWTDYRPSLALYRKELDESSARLRKDEMRRLATRIERAVKTRLAERVGLEFNSLGSGRGGAGVPADAEKPATEKDLWDRIWNDFTNTVQQAEERFTDKARGFDASPEEVEVGLWRLRRKSWSALHARIEEEVMEGNILLKLRENFEDKFRYDAEGVPRIWRPTDDIEGIYTVARQSTLLLIPLLSRFKLSKTSAPPPLDAWIGSMPSTATTADEEDLTPIGGVDDDTGATLEDETTMLSDTKAADLTQRFRKTADGVFVEAKRSAVGGVAQVPLYFYGLLLALGWNELVAVLRNPLYFIFLTILGVAAYVTYRMNMWGPMLRMADGATRVAIEEGKVKLREFLESSEAVAQQRRPMAMEGRRSEEIEMKSTSKKTHDDDDEEI